MRSNRKRENPACHPCHKIFSKQLIISNSLLIQINLVWWSLIDRKNVVQNYPFSTSYFLHFIKIANYFISVLAQTFTCKTFPLITYMQHGLCQNQEGHHKYEWNNIFHLGAKRKKIQYNIRLLLTILHKENINISRSVSIKCLTNKTKLAKMGQRD